MIAIDHLVLPVNDLTEAASVFSEAGFVVTPEAPHPFGTSNRLVVFADSYIEIVSVTDPKLLPEVGFARQVARHLESGAVGFSHVALAADSVPNTVRILAEHGLEAGEPLWFNRPAPRSDGSSLIASFDIIPIIGVDRAFFTVHHTPSNVWFRPHMEHANGATSITAVNMNGAPPLPIEKLTSDDESTNSVTLDSSIDPISVGGVNFS